ncbi:hypothetical protein [Niabella aquatica]
MNPEILKALGIHRGFLDSFVAKRARVYQHRWVKAAAGMVQAALRRAYQFSYREIGSGFSLKGSGTVSLCGAIHHPV